MATSDNPAAGTAETAERWYALSAEDVAGKFGVDPASGLSAAKAAELLQKDGPNDAARSRRASPAGGGSSTSTGPTCRSSCSSPP